MTSTAPVGKVEIENVTLTVTSPMFLGRVSEQPDHHPEPDLRPPSIKGAMRFWHRATGAEARKTEARIFGATSGTGAGQGAFLLQLARRDELMKGARAGDWDRDGVGRGKRKQGIRYLAYGMYESGGDAGRKDRRRYIEPGQHIELRLVFTPWADEDSKEAIRRSLRLLSLFGGLGARSRRGFGSVAMHSDTVVTVEQLSAMIRAEVRAVLDAQPPDGGSLPLYTMFSKKTRILILPGQNLRGWDDSLDKIGGLFSNFRKATHGSGDGAKPNPWPTAREDVHLIRAYLTGEQVSRAPARAAFGLPHNYDPFKFKEAPHKTKVLVGNDIRRASPLFFHIHRIGNAANYSFPVVITYMPAQWFPNEPAGGRKIEMKRDGTPPQRVDPPPMDAVEDFLDHLIDNGAMEVSL